MGVPLNQLVISQAAAALLLAGAARGGLPAALAAGGAAGLLALTWVRVRGRWAFGWLGVALRFAARRRSVPLRGPAAVLALAAPDSRVTALDLSGRSAAALADDTGLTMLLDLPPGTPLRLGDLSPGPDQAPAGWRLVSAGVPPVAGPGPVASSYRLLTDGRSLTQCRTVLTVRVPRTGARSEAEVRRALAGLVRRLADRFGARPLDEAQTLQAMADFAHLGDAAAVAESWGSVRLGGLLHATFDCRAAPGGQADPGLVARLLHLPARATTVSVTADRLVVRLAATGPAALVRAEAALHRLLGSEGFRARRRDGEHLSGLGSTLPLGDRGTIRDLPGVRSGLMVGRNRRGSPVRLRVFRPEPTLTLLVGSVRCAQLLVFRALAAGAGVVVRTARPAVWEPFVRAADAPVRVGAAEPPAVGTLLHPALLVLDGVAGPAADGAWQSTLVVRDEPDPAVAARADHVVLQTLSPPEAALLESALGLGEAGRLLTRMPPGMVAVVDRNAVRWTAPAPTALEKVLIGDLGRTAGPAIEVDMHASPAGDG